MQTSTQSPLPLSKILTQGRSISAVPCTSKKRSLEFIASHIAKDTPALNAEELFQALMAREKLGSTGLGQGIAIPHCRLSNCTAPMGTLVQLTNPIDFDAIDDQPIDLLFVLIVPEEATDEHLKILSSLASIFSQSDLVEKLRAATTDTELFNTFIDFEQAQAA